MRRNVYRMNFLLHLFNVTFVNLIDSLFSYHLVELSYQIFHVSLCFSCPLPPPLITIYSLQLPLQCSVRRYNVRLYILSVKRPIVVGFTTMTLVFGLSLQNQVGLYNIDIIYQLVGIVQFLTEKPIPARLTDKHATSIGIICKL